MKKTILLTIASVLLTHAWAETAPEKKLTEQERAEAMVEHRDGSAKLADDQDAVSADVQELIDEQTNPKVIKLLSEVETLMAEAIDQLELQKTGGETIAIETEIIEKIYEAAKEKSR